MKKPKPIKTNKQKNEEEESICVLLFSPICTSGSTCCQSVAGSGFLKRANSTCATLPAESPAQRLKHIAPKKEMGDRDDIVGPNVTKGKHKCYFISWKSAKRLSYSWCDDITLFLHFDVFFSVWLMLTFRSRLIYFILFIGWGQALCKLWAAFSVNQNI